MMSYERVGTSHDSTCIYELQNGQFLGWCTLRLSIICMIFIYATTMLL